MLDSNHVVRLNERLSPYYLTAGDWTPPTHCLEQQWFVVLVNTPGVTQCRLSDVTGSDGIRISDTTSYSMLNIHPHTLRVERPDFAISRAAVAGHMTYGFVDREHKTARFFGAGPQDEAQGNVLLKPGQIKDNSDYLYNLVAFAQPVDSDQWAAGWQKHQQLQSDFENRQIQYSVFANWVGENCVSVVDRIMEAMDLQPLPCYFNIANLRTPGGIAAAKIAAAQGRPVSHFNPANWAHDLRALAGFNPWRQHLDRPHSQPRSQNTLAPS